MSDGFDKLFNIAEEEKLTGANPEDKTPEGVEGTQGGEGDDSGKESQEQQSNEASQGEQQQGQEGDDDIAIITQFKELTGYEGDIKDLTVETVAGVVAEIKADIAKQYSVYDTNPQIKAVAEWIAKGGKLEDFIQIPKPFDKTVYKEDNPAHVESVLRSYYKDLKNLSDEEVQEQLDFLAATPDKQKVRFIAALDAIESNATVQYNDYVQKVEADQAKAVEEGKKLEAVIISGKFQGLTLAKEEASTFLNYVNNQELYDAKWKAFQEDPSKLALMEYLVFNDCDLSKLKNFVPIQSSKGERRTPNMIRASGEVNKPNSTMSEDEVLAALESIK